MKDGLFKRYFRIFFTTLLSCTLFLGVAMLAFSGVNYASQRQQLLKTAAEKTAEQAAETWNGNTFRYVEVRKTLLKASADYGVDVFVTDGEGNVTPVARSGWEYPDPVYVVYRVENGTMTLDMVFPGDAVEVSDAIYRFEEPEVYPSLRVKTTPVWIYALLYLSFVLMTAGLYLCFFRSGAALFLGEDGYSLAEKRTGSEWEQRLRQLLRER